MSEKDTEYVLKIEELDDALEKKVEEIKEIINQKKEIIKKISSVEFKRKVLSNLSHRLRTPLNSILGFAELLLEENYGKLYGLQEEAVNDIKSAANELLDNVVGILEIHYEKFKMYERKK